MTDKFIDTPYGQISANFQGKKLAELCIDKHGILTGPFGSQLHQRDYVVIGTPIITVEHLDENRIIHKDVPKVSDADRKRLARYTLKEGDIVFSRVGSVDRRGIVRSEEEGWLYSGRCLRVRVNKKTIDPHYLSWFFGLAAFREYIRKIAVGATMPSLNTKLLSDVIIFFPSLPEQQAIAHILGTLDDKIELNRRMNETLEAMARALFKSWFVDFDPVKAEGCNPNFPPDIAALFPNSFQNSELGEIPKGWTWAKLGDVVAINDKSITRGYRHKNIQYIDISSVTVGSLDNVTAYAIEDAPSRAKRLVVNGDTIWSCVRPNRKSYFFIYQPPDNLVVSTGFAVLTPKKIPPSFLYSWVTTNEFADYLTANADGSAYPAVRPEHFAIADILTAPTPILRKFEEIVGPIRSKIAHNENESRSLAATRDALLPQLLSGQIWVRDAEKLVEKSL